MDTLEPIRFYLSQNYPNPFKYKTTIKYCVPDKARISLEVFDSSKNRIRIIFMGIKEAGTYQAEFNASGLQNAIYFYKLQAGSFIETKKMILLK